MTWLTGKVKWLEKLLEGKAGCLIEEGKFAINKFGNESFAQDEFYISDRLHNVEHWGQVLHVFIEASGSISLFYLEIRERKLRAASRG